MARACEDAGFDAFWIAEAYPWWRKHGFEARSSTAILAVIAAQTTDDFSDRAHGRYPALWRRRERNLRFAFEIYRRIVAFADADWDREIAQLTRLSADEFAQGLKGDFTLRWLMAIAPRYAGMLVPQRLRSGAGRAASRAA